MKKILFLLAILIAINTEQLLSQETISITFTPEGVETVTESTDQLLTDPLNNNDSQYTGNLENIENQLFNFSTTVGMSVDISENSKAITIPFMFTYDEFLFDVSVPYYLSRKMIYSDGIKETSGLGDLSVGVDYLKEINKIWYQANFDVKLPTGDENKLVDNYLIPLGSGSTDYSISAKISKYFENNFSFHGSLSYRFNGEVDRTIKLKHFNEDGTERGIETIDYTITNGNVFSASLLTKYSILKNLSLNGSFI